MVAIPRAQTFVTCQAGWVRCDTYLEHEVQPGKNNIETYLKALAIAKKHYEQTGHMVRVEQTRTELIGYE